MKRLILAATVIGVATCGIVTVTSAKKATTVKNNTEVVTDKVANEENDVNESKKDVSSNNKSEVVQESTITTDDPAPLDEVSIDKPIEQTTQKPQIEKQEKPKVEKPQIEKPVENQLKKR